MENIPIIIPSYEPDDRLLKLCEELYKEGLKNVVVVDDGNGKKYEDFFKKIREKYGFKIIIHRINLGKGRGLKDAFNYVLVNMPNAIGCVTADSDGQHLVKDIKRMMDELKKHPDELIIGCRNFDSSNVPTKSKYGNKITKFVLGAFCGVKVSDTQTGLRAIPANMMEDLIDTDGERFEFETNMLIESKNKYKIRELEIETVYDSKENHSSHFNPVTDSIKIYRNIFKVFFKYIFASVASFVIDIVLFTCFCSIFKNLEIGYYIISATVLARIISSLCNYLLNHKLVFESKKSTKNTLYRYVLLVIIQMIVSAVAVQILANTFINTNESIIKIVVDTIIFFCNFFIQKYCIFEK